MIWRATAVTVGVLLLVASWAAEAPSPAHPAPGDPSVVWPPIFTPLWKPLLLAVVAGGGIGLFHRARKGAPSTRNPASRWAPPPLAPLDGALALLVTLVAATCLETVRRAVNPDGALLGMDAPTYLGNALAVEAGDWPSYNGDKRILHARIGSWLAGGGGTSVALQAVSFVSTLLLAPLTLVAARACTGRTVATFAGLAVACHPSVWPYGVQVTNYSLFAATIAAFLAVATWATHTPTLWRVVACGAAAGLAVMAMEKAVLVLVPAGAIAMVAVLPRGWRFALRGLAGAAFAAGGVMTVLAGPVIQTPFGNLVMNQREDLNRELPWRWGEVRTPDPANASPFSPLIPSPLRGGAMEAGLAAMTTPADSNGLRFVPARGTAPARWEVAAGTSIPPLPWRLAHNSWELAAGLGTSLPGLSLLVLLGFVSLAAPTPRGLVRDRFAALVLVAVVPSIYAALALKFSPRYLVHAWGPLSVLGFMGVDWLATMLVGPDRRTAAAWITAATATAWIGSRWHSDGDAWIPRNLEPLRSVPPDLVATGYPTAILEGVEALGALDAPAIYDCGPVPLRLFAPEDLRLLRSEHCADAMTSGADGSLLLVSDRGEYRGANTLTLQQSLAAGWVVHTIWEGDGLPPRDDLPASREAIILLRRP